MNYISRKDLIAFIEQMPSIVTFGDNVFIGTELYTKVIMCKDCRFNPEKNMVGCPMASIGYEPNGYCYKAKRKEE